MAGNDIILCRECKYFQENVWASVNGIPLIIAHEMCSKWGGGCKTHSAGFCFMAERINASEDAAADNAISPGKKDAGKGAEA